MSYKRYSELQNIYNQVSVNVQASRHHRSGDVTGNGGEMLDFYAYSLSPEEELIQREEAHEARAKVIRALKITRQYIQTVFSPIEIEFIKGLLTTDGTPAKIAQTLGEDYYSLSNAIYSKFEATSKTLTDSFYKVGYYCQSGLEFIPRLAAYIAVNENNRRWQLENAERRKESKRQWYLKHRKVKTAEEIAARLQARREAKLATLPPEERERQLKKWEYSDRHYAKKKAQTQ